MTFLFRPALMAGTALLFASACSEPLDLDMRGRLNGSTALNTSNAALNATADRPAADQRGIISYPGYQVAVARRGDTLAKLAARIGANAEELGRYNGVQPNDALRKGEIIALPRRVAEPAGGPIQAPVDITSVAGKALDEAEASQVKTTTLGPAPKVGIEPVRHKVERGETAFTIARLYNVSIRSLAEWNGLGSDFAIREGQHLLIPVAQPGEKAAAFDASELPATEPPGAGTPTPTPPSSTKPLPKEDTKPASQPVKTTAAPDLGKSQTKTTSGGRMGHPVRGDIIRAYSKGKNDGIDIAASPGTAVKAAASGVVAAITEDTNGVPIIVVKHPNNLLTVYSNVGNLTVKKGDSVTRGQKLAEIRRKGTAALHFEVRDGFDSVDPTDYLG